MQIVIESTGEVIELDGVPVRLWRGTTAAGVPCNVFVHRVHVAWGLDTKDFSDDLLQQEPPKMGSWA